jgi:hypothetical protein
LTKKLLIRKWRLEEYIEEEIMFNLKQIIFIIIITTMFFINMNAQSEDGSEELVKMLNDVSDSLNKIIPKNEKIVFLNVKSYSEPSSKYFVRMLSNNQDTKKTFKVVNMKDVEALYKEKGKKFSDDNAMEINIDLAKQLTADIFVFGEVEKIDDFYYLSIYFYDIKTNTVSDKIQEEIPSSWLLFALVSKEPE